MPIAEALQDLADKLILLIPLSMFVAGISLILRSWRSRWGLGIRLRWLADKHKLPARHDITLPAGNGEMVTVDHLYWLPDRLIVIAMSELDGRITHHDPNAPSWEMGSGRHTRLIDNPLRPMEQAMLAVNFATKGDVDRNGRVVTLGRPAFATQPPDAVASWPVFEAEIKSLLQTVSHDAQMDVAWQQVTDQAGPPAARSKGPPLSLWVGVTMILGAAIAATWFQL